MRLISTFWFIFDFIIMRLSPVFHLLVFTTALTMTQTTLAAPEIFYPFGSAEGDTINPASDAGSSSVIPLLSPFLFFGRRYQQICVNNDGLLTFNQSLTTGAPYLFPAHESQDIIAGLWADLDNSETGVVSYHQYTTGSVLTRATQDINRYFPDLTFNASLVFVASWDKVPYFDKTGTETSFQVVLISDSNSSFILMNYGDISVTVQPMEAGYDTINSTHFFVIPGSTDGSFISTLKSSSNVETPGQWAFRVDGESKSNQAIAPTTSAQTSPLTAAPASLLTSTPTTSSSSSSASTTSPSSSSSASTTLAGKIIGLRAKLSSFLDLTDSGNIQIVLQQIKQELVKNGLSSIIELKLRKLQKLKL